MGFLPILLRYRHSRFLTPSHVFLSLFSSIFFLDRFLLAVCFIHPISYTNKNARLHKILAPVVKKDVKKKGKIMTPGEEGKAKEQEKPIENLRFMPISKHFDKDDFLAILDEPWHKNKEMYEE
jgi:hypothetical protein